MQRIPFPILESKIAERKITKKSIAQGLGIDAVTLSRKLAGKVEFTLKEIRYIHEMFPESSVESLFGLHSDADNSKALTLSVKLDDTEFMESLGKIEKRIDEMTEKANRLKSALKECEKSAD